MLRYAAFRTPRDIQDVLRRSYILVAEHADRFGKEVKILFSLSQCR